MCSTNVVDKIKTHILGSVSVFLALDRVETASIIREAKAKLKGP
jgi:hypothetical protein